MRNLDNLIGCRMQSTIPSLDELFENFPALLRNEYYGLNVRIKKIKREDGTFEIDIPVPGIPKESLNVQFADGYVVVNSETESGAESSDDGQKGFASVFVGFDVDRNSILASLENGMLYITITPPKSSAVRITVE